MRPSLSAQMQPSNNGARMGSIPSNPPDQLNATSGSPAGNRQYKTTAGVAPRDSNTLAQGVVNERNSGQGISHVGSPPTEGARLSEEEIRVRRQRLDLIDTSEIVPASPRQSQSSRTQRNRNHLVSTPHMSATNGRETEHASFRPAHGQMLNGNVTASLNRAPPRAPTNKSPGNVPQNRGRAAIASNSAGVAEGVSAIPTPMVISNDANSLTADEGMEGFSGRIVAATDSWYKVKAKFDGRNMTGWVMDVESNGIPRLTKRNLVAGGGDCDGNSLAGASSAGPAKRPRKQPVAICAPRANVIGRSGSDDEQIAPIPHGGLPGKSVVVIGAGIAGLACASLLMKRGFNVIVLEGRKRIGGRVHTDWSLGSPVDLGAMFIHGVKNNPLTEIVLSEGLRRFHPQDVSCLRFEDGRKVDADLDLQTSHAFNALLAKAGDVAKLLGEKDDISLHMAIEKIKPHLPIALENDVCKMLLTWQIRNLEMPCAAMVEDLSAKFWDLDLANGLGGNHELLRDGYSALAHSLAKGVNIKTGCCVTEIQHEVAVQSPIVDVPVGNSALATNNGANGGTDNEHVIAHLRKEDDKASPASNFAPRRRPLLRGQWRPDASRKTHGVRVKTANGKQYVAEHCIVTLPLGVLKNEDVRFSPRLPDWKRKAVANIGFGLLNKVALRFDKVFWDDDAARDNMLDGERKPEHEHRKRDKRFAQEHDPVDSEEKSDYIARISRNGEFFMFLSQVRNTGAPILIAFTAGDFAEKIEGMSDSFVINKAVTALRDMFAKAKDAVLVSAVVTRWRSDKFARGSYSFAGVGATPDDWKMMAKPVGPKQTLQFAGEATNFEHPGTAHGAFLSGSREARRVIENSDLPTHIIDNFVKEILKIENPDPAIEGGHGSHQGATNVKQNGTIARKGRRVGQNVALGSGKRGNVSMRERRSAKRQKTTAGTPAVPAAAPSNGASGGRRPVSASRRASGRAKPTGGTGSKRASDGAPKRGGGKSNGGGDKNGTGSSRRRNPRNGGRSL